MIRRDILRLGSAAALATLLHWPSHARPFEKPPVAIFDGRYSDARLFAEAARARGARAFDTQGDVASLWHGRGVQWDEATTLIGLTAYADLLIISELARSLDLGPKFQVMHDARGGAKVRHVTEDATAGAPDFGAGRAWPVALADCIDGSAGMSGARERAGPRSADHPGTLWSWMYEDKRRLG